MRRNEKRGSILIENIIFIILNVVFISILVLFLFLKTGDSPVFEEIYAKQIALIIDSSKPGMIIHLNMEKALEKAEKDLGKDRIGEVVKIQNNIVTVKLREQGGYSYSFFNDVDVSSYPDTLSKKEYVFVIGDYKE